MTRDAWDEMRTDRLLDEIADFVRRFVVLTREQADAIALWVLHTHAIAAAQTTPYLAITSAEKRSGKSRLLEVLALLVREPLKTVNISDAALFRMIEERQPTLLFDEVDAIFGTRSRDREDLRGMLNAGFQRGSLVYRMSGQNMTTLTPFAVFCAKALAGIGRFPDTIQDRSISLRLQRRARNETIERFRRREVAPAAEELSLRAADWADPNVEALAAARPHLPDELDDRAQDVWEPLLAIAEYAGPEWRQRAHTAAIALSSGENREDESKAIQLLRDIRDAFVRLQVDRLITEELIDELERDKEKPWGHWYGKRITPQALSQILQPFGIKTLEIWVRGAKARGYRRDRLEPVWERYLPELVDAVDAVDDDARPHVALPPPTADTDTTGSPATHPAPASTTPTSPTSPLTLADADAVLSEYPEMALAHEWPADERIALARRIIAAQEERRRNDL